LQADNHIDHVLANHRLMTRTWKKAIQRQARGLVFGDFFCAMQGKWDKRKSMAALRPELAKDNYLQVLPAYAAEIVRPYKDIFDLWTPGNHEQSILDHHQFDLLQALVEQLNGVDQDQIKIGSMRGWVMFDLAGHLIRLHYTHGYGGGGPVTKDTIQINRQMNWLGDVDILVSSHTHDQLYLPLCQMYLDDDGVPQERTVHCIKVGNYKPEHRTGRGYTALKGHGPKPLGAWWLHFTNDEEDGVKIDVLRAA
jgi:hypothetical protein